MSICRVLFFASLKDRAGVRQSTLEIQEGSTVSELKVILQEHFPSIKPVLPNALIAVNREYAMDDTLIPSDAEIALFPPVSGG